MGAAGAAAGPSRLSGAGAVVAVVVAVVVAGVRSGWWWPCP